MVLGRILVTGDFGQDFVDLGWGFNDLCWGFGAFGLGLPDSGVLCIGAC